ncbi:unnamed protein product, partial [Mesorhabditis spiculigera]
MFATSTSPPEVARKMLFEHRNISLWPDDPNIAAIIGYESIFQKTCLAIIIWICFPVIPGYAISIILRRNILKRITSNGAMSENTKKAQKDLVKLILPLVMMSQASGYFWRQFKLPLADYFPYFEEWSFLNIAIVSLFNPLVTLYYVKPYRKKVIEMFPFCFNRQSRKTAQAAYEAQTNSENPDGLAAKTEMLV